MGSLLEADSAGRTKRPDYSLLSTFDSGLTQKFGESQFADAFARIECHYFVNRGFFDREDQLLRNGDRIRHLPIVIVQGRYDIVCPMISAWELHHTLPEAEFIVVPDAGHSMTEPGIRQALLDATDRFAEFASCSFASN
jgi:proline iminopeptidase